MSTGAWIFTGLLCAAVIAPAGVYAASIAKVRIVGADGKAALHFTPQHQLLTGQVSPKQIVRIASGSLSGCKSIYTPPAHKAIVVTSVVYTFGSGTQGTEHFGGMGDANCTHIYDQIDGVQAFDTIQHTYPTGLPMSSIALTNSGSGLINIFLVGYLIDSTSLPANAPAVTRSHIKAVHPTR